MFCSKCGFELPDYANFCLNCGLALKDPVPDASKTTLILDVHCTGYQFTTSSTDASIIKWCKQQFISQGIDRKFTEHPGNELPGRFYFDVKNPLIDKHGNPEKLIYLYKIYVDKLISEGWKNEPNNKDRYTKEI